MTFEEWSLVIMHDPDIDMFQSTALDLFNMARQGMIPEDEATRIPPVEEWPPEATHIELVYVDETRKEFGKQFIDSFAFIPRPTPQWTPNVGDAVFWNGGQEVANMVVRVNRSTKDGISVLSTSGGRWSAKLSNLKPFDPAYIGKPWDEIPGGK
jgi:hypothetical protein